MWFGRGLGLTWQVNVIKMLLDFFLNYWYYHKKHILSVKKVVLDGLEVVWRWFVVVWVFPRTLTGRIISKKKSFRG